MYFRAALIIAFLMGYTVTSFGQSQQLPDKKVLTLRAAKQLAEAARIDADKKGLTVVIAIVDDGNNILYLERMDKAKIGGIDTAVLKARTAVGYQQPTKMWEEQLKTHKRAELLNLPGFIPLAGGVPLLVDGQVVGAIGISGASSDQDGEIADAGAKALVTRVGRNF